MLTRSGSRRWLGMGLPGFRRYAKLHAQPFHHACGSCPADSRSFVAAAMDPEEVVAAAATGAVVGPDFRVLGISRLRLADASVFPTLPSVPTAASAMMVGVLAAR